MKNASRNPFRIGQNPDYKSERNV